MSVSRDLGLIVRGFLSIALQVSAIAVLVTGVALALDWLLDGPKTDQPGPCRCEQVNEDPAPMVRPTRGVVR